MGQSRLWLNRALEGSVANRNSGRDRTLPGRLSSGQDFELLSY